DEVPREGRRRECFGVVGKISGYKLRGRRDRSAPSEKMVKIAAVGAAGVRRGRRLAVVSARVAVPPLVPASAAVPAATSQEHNDKDDDQNCRIVHTALLRLSR